MNRAINKRRKVLVITKDFAAKWMAKYTCKNQNNRHF
jgi:hypothetical protein